MDNEFGVSDDYYPLPYSDWGDTHYDIALAVALADITGSGISQSTRSATLSDIAIATTLERPSVGIRLYSEE